MKNDIYDLLNDIDNQIDTFETVDITSTDLKNWKQSFALKKKLPLKNTPGKNMLLPQLPLLFFLVEAVLR